MDKGIWVTERERRNPLMARRMVIKSARTKDAPSLTFKKRKDKIFLD